MYSVAAGELIQLRSRSMTEPGHYFAAAVAACGVAASAANAVSAAAFVQLQARLV